MDRKEIVNSQDYKAQGIALDWWRRNGYDIRDGVVDIIDAYADGVIYGWNNPQWIPVEERLPENVNGDSERVLFVVQEGIEFIGRFDWDLSLWRAEGLLFSPDEVTHWMPLPQLPKTE